MGIVKDLPSGETGRASKITGLRVLLEDPSVSLKISPEAEDTLEIETDRDSIATHRGNLSASREDLNALLSGDRMMTV